MQSQKSCGEASTVIIFSTHMNEKFSLVPYIHAIAAQKKIKSSCDLFLGNFYHI